MYPAIRHGSPDMASWQISTETRQKRKHWKRWLIWTAITSTGYSFRTGIINITGRWAVHAHSWTKYIWTSLTGRFIQVRWKITLKRSIVSVWSLCFTIFVSGRWRMLLRTGGRRNGICLRMLLTLLKTVMICRADGKVIFIWSTLLIRNGRNIWTRGMMMYMWTLPSTAIR